MLTADYLVESRILSVPNYIFIDAAFYEQDIIKGMKNLLMNKSKPTAILIEQTLVVRQVIDLTNLKILLLLKNYIKLAINH